MKMTMHIDEALLAEVMEATGAASKTAAVHEALIRVASKFRQRSRWKKGLDMSADEILAGYDAEAAIGAPENGVPMAAETPVRYGTKRPR